MDLYGIFTTGDFFVAYRIGVLKLLRKQRISIFEGILLKFLERFFSNVANLPFHGGLSCEAEITFGNCYRLGEEDNGKRNF